MVASLPRADTRAHAANGQESRPASASRGSAAHFGELARFLRDLLLLLARRLEVDIKLDPDQHWHRALRRARAAAAFNVKGEQCAQVRELR